MRSSHLVLVLSLLVAGCGGNGISIPDGGAVHEGFTPGVPADTADSPPAPEGEEETSPAVREEQEIPVMEEEPEPLVMEEEEGATLEEKVEPVPQRGDEIARAEQQGEDTFGDDVVAFNNESVRAEQQGEDTVPVEGQGGRSGLAFEKMVMFRDILAFSYEKALSGTREDVWYGFTNRFLLSRRLSLGMYPLETTIFMEQVGEAVIGGRVDRVADFDSDTALQVRTYRQEYNKYAGYNIGLDYNQLSSAAHWLQPRLRFGLWLVRKRFYVSGGVAYRRIFPSWNDITDNAVCADQTRWSFDARFALPLGRAGILDCRGFMEGESVDGTADLRVDVSYYPRPGLGFTFVMDKETRLLLGEVRDIGLGVTWTAPRVVRLGLTWRARDYSSLGDHDNILGVQLSIRM